MKTGKIISKDIRSKLELGLHVVYDGKMWIVGDENAANPYLMPSLDSPDGVRAERINIKNLFIVDDKTGLEYQLGFIDWAKAIAHNLIDNDVSIPYMIHPLGWYRKEATIDWVGYPNFNVMKLSFDENFEFTEEDLLRAFEAGEYKMEYPKTAPNFEYFLNTLKFVKSEARKVSSAE